MALTVTVWQWVPADPQIHEHYGFRRWLTALELALGSLRGAGFDRRAADDSSRLESEIGDRTVVPGTIHCVD